MEKAYLLTIVGTYYYENKDRYEGDWKDDIVHGNGIYYYEDGSRYDGQWENDKANGKGNFY